MNHLRVVFYCLMLVNFEKSPLLLGNKGLDGLSAEWLTVTLVCESKVTR
ncbi:hypothetical protein I8J31_15540 [Marinomonas sp. C1424]|uniref:Uncharacterized protein n=1 Tax=Marinomonas transparens TaxID=2795388 RepID=A0A934JXI7_9GAMM|nr:hypothetical protein [Marinomonas transparens]